jgi:uncharacterized membrane protein YjjP (DUF1212 family)
MSYTTLLIYFLLALACAAVAGAFTPGWLVICTAFIGGYMLGFIAAMIVGIFDFCTKDK